MALETGKLYLVADESTATNERPALLELNGTVDITVYGSETEQADVASMTPATDQITESFYQTLSEVPKYITFVGSATRIELKGRKLTEVKDIS